MPPQTTHAASNHADTTQELEYLCDASVISPQTLNELLQKVPAQTALHAPISVGALPSAVAAAQQPPTSPMNDLNLNGNNSARNDATNEKNGSYYQPTPSPAPPPAYNSAPPPAANWPPLAQATALYAYTSTDAGDLQLQPGDSISVTEYMNAEWWKGRSARTGQEGIFPRSYVKVVDEKSAAHAAPAAPNYGNNYGNMPLETSQMGNGESKVPGKGQEMGKKFGKKLGNAAIFGAGATIGGNIVNSIF